MWLDTFNQMRKNSGMSLDELCAKSGVPKGTLTKITSGVTKAPAFETMRSLVYAMGYTLDDLDGGLEASKGFSKEEQSHIKKYRTLDPHGKSAVDSILNIEYQRCQDQRSASDSHEKEAFAEEKASTAIERAVEQYRQQLIGEKVQDAQASFASVSDVG